ncbi:MAG: ribokinase [Thermoleophilaceae bacterium]|nr:ribokinase [Thermoleophilaceae bacterium]
MRVAVVGHVEWVEFALVDHVPARGEIVHARGTFAEPAGGGAVAAVQLARLAGSCALFTALGDDELGQRAAERLERLGVTVHATFRDHPQRRAFTCLDSEHERTIIVLGERLGPSAADELPWDELEGADAVYFTSGDPGAARLARRARALVATARALPALREARVRLDALVASAKDRGERYQDGDLDPAPALVVRTEGAAGGRWSDSGGGAGSFAAAPLPGEPRDAYGCGDSFAAGLAYGLGEGRSVPNALELAARCGAACLTGRGPYERQLADAG